MLNTNQFDKSFSCTPEQHEALVKKKCSQKDTKTMKNANDKVIKFHTNKKHVQFLGTAKRDLELMLQAQREKEKR